MRILFITLLVILLALTLRAQQFQKITAGDLVNTPSDSRSVNFVDVNNDGWDDIFITNGLFGGQDNMLYISNQDGTFVTVSDNDIVEDGTPSVGASFADYDNDGEGNFTKSQSDLPLLEDICSYGAAWGDINDDGFIDLMIAQCKNSSQDEEHPNTLYQNTGNDNNWVKIKLNGLISNAAAIGAKIRIKAVINGENVWQMRVLSAQSGYCGQNSLNTHFGLADAIEIDSLIVEWPLGATSILKDIPANTQLIIPEPLANSIQPEPNRSITKSKVYPNPFHNHFIVEYTLPDDYPNNQLVIRLTDSLGKRIEEKQVPVMPGEKHLKINWNVNNLPDGIYLLKLNGSNTRPLKIIRME